jgi:hypothetical protein
MNKQIQDPFTFKSIFERKQLHSLIGGFVMLGIAFVFEHIASVYALAYSLRPTSTYVGDLFLDNLPVVNLNLIIVEGALFGILLGILFLIFNPRYIIFTLKVTAVFIATRAFFTSLTHIGIYPGQINPGPGPFDAIYSYLNFQTGFFFSGHTGLPFLTALIFWGKPLPRNIFLWISGIFGVAVLLAHVHYSIDVFAAPFMAYGIFKICEKVFSRDYELITSAPDLPTVA